MQKTEFAKELDRIAGPEGEWPGSLGKEKMRMLWKFSHGYDPRAIKRGVDVCLLKFRHPPTVEQIQDSIIAGREEIWQEYKKSSPITLPTEGKRAPKDPKVLKQMGDLIQNLSMGKALGDE